MSQTLEALEFVTGPEPTASIIVLHGLGADGNDFVPVAQMLDLGVPVRFIFPHAPQMPVTINNGYVMRAWYDILGTDLARREDEAGLRRSQAAIEALIAREVERGIPAERIVLMGFSQGCAMTLMTGLRHKQRLGGAGGGARGQRDSGGQHGLRAQRRQPEHPHLHGPRPGRSGRGHRTCHGFARPAAVTGLHGGLA